MAFPTGCLMYRSGFFEKILEGDREKLEALYEKVGFDSRRGDFHLMAGMVVGERACDNLKMGIVLDGGDHICNDERSGWTNSP